MILLSEEYSREDIYRKYVENALKLCTERYLSLETSCIHVSSLSHLVPINYAQACPVEENILYSLLLLRTKMHEHVNQAKEHLEKILSYQNSDGSFPTLLTEVSTCTNWAVSFRLLIPISQILNDFSSVLGSTLHDRLEKALKSLIEWCARIVQDRFSSPALSLLLYAVESSGLLSEDERDSALCTCIEKVLDSEEWTDFSMIGHLLVAVAPHIKRAQSSQSLTHMANKLFSRLFKLWSDRLGYVGPSFSILQNGYSEGMILFHVVMSLLCGKKLSEKVEHWPYETLFNLAIAYPVIHVEPNKIDVTEEGGIGQRLWGVFRCDEGIAVSYIQSAPKKCHKGFSPLRIVTPTWTSAVKASTYTLEHIEERKENGKTSIFFHFHAKKESMEEGQEERSRVGDAFFDLFIERKKGIAFFPVSRKKATSFSLNDPFCMGAFSTSEGRCVQVKIHCEEEEFSSAYASLRAGSRPGQLMVPMPNGAKRYALPPPEAHDWQLSFQHSQGKKPRSFVVEIASL